MQTAIAKEFRSSSVLRIDHLRVGTPCTILKTQYQWMREPAEEIALVEFADGVRRIWPVNALEVK